MAQRNNGRSSILSLLLRGQSQESHHHIKGPSSQTQRSTGTKWQSGIQIAGSQGMNALSEPIQGLYQQRHQACWQCMKPIRMSHRKQLSSSVLWRSKYGKKRNKGVHFHVSRGWSVCLFGQALCLITAVSHVSSLNFTFSCFLVRVSLLSVHVCADESVLPATGVSTGL